MTGAEIRQKFLKFFESKEHKIMPSSSLIPTDPTVLLTLAGMLQFKPIFLGEEKPAHKRVTTVQKCVRMIDIDEVGKTSRHHTFFEMLGNFSFGDYFKKEAIVWAWELLTKGFKISPGKMLAAVYEKDDEAYDIWHKVIGLSKDKICRLGKDNNFWAAGPTGPCGPCSEIYYDLGLERGCGKKDCQPGCDCDRFLEVWNLVFMEYNRDEKGELHPLPQKNVDTGMGLERLAAVLQGAKTNFDTDLIKPIIEATKEICGLKLPKVRYKKPTPKISESSVKSLRIIADHVRAVTHLIADGVVPSNEGRGYVLRRILRRAVRHGQLIGIKKPFLFKLSSIVVDLGYKTYPELKEKSTYIAKVVKAEEESFGKVLAQGTDLLKEVMVKTSGKVISGQDAFRLYDTFGFPFELTKEMAAEEGFSVDGEGFLTEMESQRERARKTGKISGERPRGGESIIAKTEKEKIEMAQHHTATHLLQAALRKYFGSQVEQQGSLVDPKYLRFDFNFIEAVGKDRLRDVEKIVNIMISEKIAVKKYELSFSEARSKGALAFFGEKYGEKVRVVEIPGLSLELCGGTHVDNIGEIELLKIVSEGSVAAGIRRIEAVAGDKAKEYMKQSIEELEKRIKKLGGKSEEEKFLDLKGQALIDRFYHQEKILKEEVAKLEKKAKEEEKAKKKAQVEGIQIDQMKAQKIKDFLVVAEKLPDGLDYDVLRNVADKVEGKWKAPVNILASGGENSVKLLVKVSPHLVKKGILAGDIVRVGAKVVGGGGGGKPAMAQAGGKDPTKIQEALTKMVEMVKAKL